MRVVTPQSLAPRPARGEGSVLRAAGWRPNTRQRESPVTAARRARLDRALVGLVSDAGLRRSKSDPEAAGAVVAITATTLGAIEELRGNATDDDRVIGLSPRQIARRIQAAGEALRYL